VVILRVVLIALVVLAALAALDVLVVAVLVVVVLLGVRVAKCWLQPQCVHQHWLWQSLVSTLLVEAAARF